VDGGIPGTESEGRRENGKGEAMDTIYEEMMAAGVAVDSHESDLYVADTTASRSILSRHDVHVKNAKGFTNAVTGDRWIDIPFAFDPFWIKKGRRA
jgi:hypothetical protein